MRPLLISIAVLLPSICFGQTEVGPDGYFPLLVIGLLVVVPLLVWALLRLRTGRVADWFPWMAKRRLDIDLVPNRSYRPVSLTLVVRNQTRKDVDIEAPVLLIRKLWSIRKFRLKGINRAEIYPLYLEKGKTHELQIHLSVFHKHDPSLRSYYWARVLLKDKTGNRYATNYVTLRKSLVS